MIISLSSSSGSNSNGEKSSDDNNTGSGSDPSSGDIPKWNQSRRKAPRPVLHNPPWMDNVRITPELLYQYQMETKELVEVLQKDMEILKRTKQVCGYYYYMIQRMFYQTIAFCN